MTGRTEGHLDEQARGDAVSLNILSAKTPSGQLQRRVGPQLKVGGRGIEPTRLGLLWRGSILAPEEPGGVAGPRSNGTASTAACPLNVGLVLSPSQYASNLGMGLGGRFAVRAHGPHVDYPFVSYKNEDSHALFDAICRSGDGCGYVDGVCGGPAAKRDALVEAGQDQLHVGNMGLVQS